MPDGLWFLEGVAADGSPRRHSLTVYPCRVGREPDNDLVLYAPGLSRHHAELHVDVSGRLRLVDLDSSNGSFVNRERITGAVLLNEGDVLHFGTVEFRLQVDAGAAPPPAEQADPERTVLVPPDSTLPGHFVPKEKQFHELLAGRGLSAAIQPIVFADDRSLFAWELLGRGTHPELPGSPIHLFNLASLLQREAELSHALREHGVRALAPHARRYPDTPLFVNTHPKETFEEGFLQALERLQAEFPHLPLVVEIHENAVMEVERMRELAGRLQAMGLQFAYDDFGAGQARLNELCEVPPSFVKFDMGLVRGIHQASERKQKVVADLVRLVHELGAMALAEGVEEAGEMAVCQQMGFELIQGYLTGRPGPIPVS
jgi:EAL domain-containing protein (putative c-di-GMP-specific phosphodiesterase class I)